MGKFIQCLSIILMLLGVSSTAHAEQMKRLGQWDVHYIALGTSFLTPEVARTYGIQRSRYNGMINISVLDSDSQKAQSVVVEGTAKNLIGVSKKLNFKEIQEGEAIYYIAVLPFRDDESFQFNVQIRHGNEQQSLKFKHKFYPE